MPGLPTRRSARFGLVAVLAITSLVTLACDPSPPVAPVPGSGGS